MLLVALINANDDGMKVTMREYEKKTNREISSIESDTPKARRG